MSRKYNVLIKRHHPQRFFKISKMAPGKIKKNPKDLDTNRLQVKENICAVIIVSRRPEAGCLENSDLETSDLQNSDLET